MYFVDAYIPFSPFWNASSTQTQTRSLRLKSHMWVFVWMPAFPLLRGKWVYPWLQLLEGTCSRTAGLLLKKTSCAPNSCPYCTAPFFQLGHQNNASCCYGSSQEEDKQMDNSRGWRQSYGTNPSLLYFDTVPSN